MARKRSSRRGYGRKVNRRNKLQISRRRYRSVVGDRF